jgi:hypothetical protein
MSPTAKVPRICALLAAAIVSLPSGNAAADTVTDIQRGAAAFYDVYLEARPAGVPRGKALAKLAPVISPSLAELLQRAGAAERRYAKVTANKVPPLVEGDLFTSLFEGAQSIAIRECHRGAAGGAACMVELQTAGAAGKPPTRWTDKIYLVRHDRRWVVDDIEYGGDWQFMHRGRLREILRRVVRDGEHARP